MLIPMNSEAIVLSDDKTQPRDRFGKYPKKETSTQARVAFSTQFVRTPDGTQKQAKLEIDFPPEVIVQEGDKIKAKDIQGLWHEAEILLISDATNFAGNRVFYRTVVCG